MRRISIASFSALLMLGVAIPLIFLAALLVWQLQVSERAALERRTVREATAISMAVDRVLQDMRSTLKLVASAPELKAGNLHSFHDRARSALEGSATFVIVVDETGKQLLNTRVPYGTGLGKTSDMSSLKKAMDAEREIFSGVFLGRTSGAYVFNLIQPLPPTRDTSARAIITTRDANTFEELLKDDGLADGWTSALIDGAGVVIATSKPEDYPSGKNLGSSPALNYLAPSGLVIADGNSIGNVGDLISYSRVGQSGWSVVIWGPMQSAQASIFDTWRYLIGGTIFLLLLAGIALHLITRSMNLSIVGLATMAEQLSRGEVVPPSRSKIREIDTVATMLSTASFDRHKADEQIRFVLRELAHRTKNLMAILMAIVRQTGRTASSVEEFQNSVNERISGLAQSINLLTDTQWQDVQLKELVKSQLSVFADVSDNVNIEGDDLAISAEAVQVLGMAIHELATNSIKYGSLASPGGSLHISWNVHEGDPNDEGEARFGMRWVERGGKTVTPPKRKGFGTRVTQTQIETAFKGRVNVDFSPEGLVWELDAPLESLSSSSER